MKLAYVESQLSVANPSIVVTLYDKDYTVMVPYIFLTVVVTCPGPFSLPDGSVDPAICSLAQALPYNTECDFSCGNGFVQQGPSSKTCTDNASWDNTGAVTCTGKFKYK